MVRSGPDKQEILIFFFMLHGFCAEVEDKTLTRGYRQSLENCVQENRRGVSSTTRAKLLLERDCR
jgi:hypothetical protein